MGKVGDMGFDVLMVSFIAKCDKNEDSGWRGSDFFRGGLLRCESSNPVRMGCSCLVSLLNHNKADF